jgi:hypothetical protein
MAYIIGEPIIRVAANPKGGTNIEVRFPVMETHSGQRHYRGITLALDPEKLYMLAEGQVSPVVRPAMPIDQFDVPDTTYVDSLMKMAELEDEVRKMAEDENIDLEATDKLEEWKRDAFRRASELLFGPK